jgi:photosystem II stability/assembly factor-like uncharacterized protein
VRAALFTILATAIAVGISDAAPQWQALPNAPSAVRIDGLHFIDASRGWCATSDGQIFRTIDGGATWQNQLSDYTVYFRCISFADALHGFAGTLTSDALLYRTVDGGAHWNVVSNIPEPRPSALCGLWSATSQVIYGVGSYYGPARVIKSVDGGATWSSQDLAPLASTLIDVYFKSATEGFAVGGIDEFPSTIRSVVLHTTNGGATWQQVYVGTRYAEWGWKISFPTPLTGYVSLEREGSPMYLLKTTNGGPSWTELAFENYNEQGIGFATTQIGWIGGLYNPTFGTTDGGATWTQTPWGEYIDRFQFLGPTLGYASGVTIYKYWDSTVGIPPVTTNVNRPRAVPNPFGNRTSIEYTLERPERVQILISDPAGRIVRRLQDGPQDAGPHQAQWDGSDDGGAQAPAGIYLYILHAGARHESGKIARVR